MTGSCYKFIDICVCVHTHTHIYTYIHTYIYTHIMNYKNGIIELPELCLLSESLENGIYSHGTHDWILCPTENKNSCQTFVSVMLITLKSFPMRNVKIIWLNFIAIYYRRKKNITELPTMRAFVLQLMELMCNIIESHKKKKLISWVVWVLTQILAETK